MAVDWPERAGGRLPAGAVRVSIARGAGEDDRIVRVDGPSA